MFISLEQLNELLKIKENEHLEFKEAKNSFDFEKLVKYCAALANEGGGKLVLGVTDKRPRKIVGSQAFINFISKMSCILVKIGGPDWLKNLKTQ